MKIIKALLLCYCLFLLTGCPTEFQKLEEFYYKDDFFSAASQLVVCVNDEKSKSELSPFIERNGNYLQRKLLQNIQFLFRYPSIEGVDQLRQLNDDLALLHQEYPNLFKKDFLDLTEKTYLDLLGQFSNAVIADSNAWLPQGKYRSTYEQLKLLADKKALPTDWAPTLEQLEPILVEHLYIFPPKVHDSSVADLEAEFKENNRFNYDEAPKHLLYSAVNIPAEFKPYLKKSLNTYKSQYLQFSKKEEAQYQLQYRVGIHVDEDIIESKKEVTDTFRVKYSGEEQWHNKTVTYEVYTKSKQVHAIVDAQVILSTSNKIVSHYIFESIVPHNRHSVGDILSDTSDIVEMEHSKAYKRYKYGIIEHSMKELINNALDDAALVLAFKVLDTIDQDPSPHLIESNPTITWPKE